MNNLLIAPADLTPDRVKMLVYADVGQGKTAFAATCPNALYVSVEGGEATLMQPPHAIDPRTRIFRATQWEDMRTVYVNLRDRTWPFESVIIDTITDLQDKALFEVMAREEAKDSKRPKGRPQRNDYQEVANMMRRMMMRYRDLPLHVIFVAHYQDDRAGNPNPGTVSSRAIRAAVMPNVYKALSAYVDIMGFMVKVPETTPDGRPTGKINYTMVFEDPTRTFQAKTRFRLPQFIQNPTFPDLLALIRQGLPNV